MTFERYSFQNIQLRERVVLWELRGFPTPAQWQVTLAAATLWMSDLESRGQKMGVVIDPTDMVSVDADTRRAAGQWRAAQMPLIANSCICAAYVAPNALLRGAIAAILWLAKPEIPVSLKATREEAILWVEDEIRRLNGSIYP